MQKLHFFNGWNRNLVFFKCHLGCSKNCGGHEKNTINSKSEFIGFLMEKFHAVKNLGYNF